MPSGENFVTVKLGTEGNQNIYLRNGLADVIGLDWLRMFSSKELSTLVAGAEHEINVSDLQVSHHQLFYWKTMGHFL